MISLYSTARIAEPIHEIISLDSSPLDLLFTADREVGAAALDPEQYVDIDSYKTAFNWIRWLLKSPSLRNGGLLIGPADADAASRALPELPESSPVRAVVRAIRTLLQHPDELRQLSQNFVQVIATHTFAFEIVLVQDQEHLKESWDAIDELRQAQGLPPLSRVSTRSKRTLDDERAVAITLGLPHYSTARFRWACWPPIAPRILSVGWTRDITTTRRRNETDLSDLESLWNWRRTETHRSIAPLNSKLLQTVPSASEAAQDAEDPWDAPVLRSSNGTVEFVRRFHAYGRNEIVTDRQRPGTPISPFLALVNESGKIVVGEDAPDPSGWMPVLIHAISAASNDDRKRIHALPELRNFKIRISALPDTRRQEVLRRIASAMNRSLDSVKGLFRGWSGSEIDCPYLPDSDLAFRMLVQAAGMTEADGRRLEGVVSRAIGRAIAEGQHEAREWRRACEAAQLTSDCAAAIRAGVCAKLTVGAAGRWSGIVEIIPLGAEIEDPWRA